MKKTKNLFILFVSMLKIGLFTFGGGYAMISVLENEFVSRRSWLEHDEFLDLVAIAESTPGPIAINCATYIGYKKGKLLGALSATLGMVIPSFVIIYLVSLFFNRFLELSYVNSAFRGIRVCIVFLILSAGIKMLKKIKKTVLSVTIIVTVFLCMTIFTLFAVDFSSVFYVLISGGIGLSVYSIRYIKLKNDTRDEKSKK